MKMRTFSGSHKFTSDPFHKNSVVNNNNKKELSKEETGKKDILAWGDVNKYPQMAASSDQNRSEVSKRTFFQNMI